jgi:hypothetical protein
MTGSPTQLKAASPLRELLAERRILEAPQAVALIRSLAGQLAELPLRTTIATATRDSASFELTSGIDQVQPAEVVGTHAVKGSAGSVLSMRGN